MDKKSPRVTVLMATWNRTQTIGHAIQSVLDQTFSDWELVVAGDGSPADTEAVIREWQTKDERIRYTRIEHSGLVAVVSNAGLRVARGEFIAILDDDDWWMDKEKLEKQVEFLDTHADYIACGGGFAVVDKDGSGQSRIMKPETDGAMRRIALFANPIVNSTSMFRRNAGFYDETLTGFQDWDFWLRVGQMGKLYNFQEYFTAYRIWDGSGSFMSQRENTMAALVIVHRYRREYSGFIRAIILARLYWCYSYFPDFIRRGMNAKLSKLKKFIFSR